MTTPPGTPACWLAPTQGTAPAAAIARVGVLQPLREQFLRFELFDTFGWSLWYSGLLLVARGGREPGLELHDRNRFGDAPPLATWPGQLEPPRSRGGWPAGEMARRVGPLIELRALVPVAKLRIRIGLFDVKNEDAKTVVRLARETWSPRRGDGTLEVWRLLELRGYDEERAAVGEAMGSAGLSPSTGSAIEAARHLPDLLRPGAQERGRGVHVAEHEVQVPVDVAAGTRGARPSELPCHQDSATSNAPGPREGARPGHRGTWEVSKALKKRSERARSSGKDPPAEWVSRSGW